MNEWKGAYLIDARMDEHFLFVILFIIISNPRNTIPIAMKLYITFIRK